MGRIFSFELGLRAGWSLALFLFIYSALTLGAQFSFGRIKILRDWAATQPHGVISPVGLIAFTGLELAILLIATGVTALVEKRSFAYYGLAEGGQSLPRFFGGIVFGIAMASLLIGLMARCGGYSVKGLAIGTSEILPNACLYGLGFLLVGFFEEFAFRGYMQTTLQRGIGTWPATILLSLAFGAIHLPNPQVTWIGASVAASFGLLGVYSLVRTGSLWFIIGVHAAFDWSISFLYSCPIAGLPAQGHLLDAVVQGPAWVTGGNTGPVGSTITFAVIAIAAGAIHFIFPRQSR